MSVEISARGRQAVRVAVARAVREMVRGGKDAKDAAVALSVTPKTVDRWVSGDGYPSFTQAVRLAPMFDIDPTTGKSAPGGGA